MKVSVVIPVYNEEEYLGKCLESIANQTVPPDEIIVVDNNSTDHSVEVAQKYKVRIINEKTQGAAYARNRGFAEAKYDILARCDADTILPSKWVEWMKQDFETRDIIGIGGIFYWYDATFPQLTSFILNFFCVYFPPLLIGTPVLIGSNMILKKEMWEKVKNDLCSQKIIFQEDYDFSFHLKKYGKLYNDKRMCVYTTRRRLSNLKSAYFQYPAAFIKMLFYHWFILKKQ